MKRLDPGAFAFVMATGIVSTALDRDGTRTVSTAPLVAGVGFVVLLLAYRWRLLRWRRSFATDLVGPRGFAFLTVMAAANVLASGLLASGRIGVAVVLLVFGAVAWLVLGYGVPLGLITSRERHPSLDQVKGTWFIWVVGTESVAVTMAGLSRVSPRPTLGLIPLRYGVATRGLGHATETSWLDALGGGEAWVAAAVWLVVFGAMAKALVRALSGSHTPPAQ